MRAFGSGVSVRCAKDGAGKNPAQVHCKSLTDLTANTRDFYAVRLTTAENDDEPW
jgi:hypothetical protein